MFGPSKIEVRHPNEMSRKLILTLLVIGCVEKQPGPCFICEKELNSKDKTVRYVENPTDDEPVRKIIHYSQQRTSYGDAFFSTLSKKEPSTCKAYHHKCYRNLVNSTNLKKLRERYEESLRRGSSSSNKRGRPSSIIGNEDHALQPRAKRTASAYNNEKCIFCQSESEKELHLVLTGNMGNRIIKILNNSSNANYHAIAATFLEDLDVQAYDTRYHLSCLVSEERKSFASDGKETLTIARVLADIEIVNIVKFSIDRGDVLTMNDINQEYKYILQENNAADIVDNYKKHICGLLRQKIPYVQINPSHRRNESHRVSSQRTVSAALNEYEEAGDPEDEVQTLMNAAMILRRVIQKDQSWHFKGSFDDFKLPEELYMFCRWVISGHDRTLSEKRTHLVDRSACIVAQHMMAAFKTDRQIGYQTKEEGTGFKTRRETPLLVALPLAVHSITRSKRLVNLLEDLSLGQSYKEVIKMESQVATAVCRRLHDTSGYVLPPFVCKDKPVFFAIDNIDRLIHDPSGKEQFHGTVITLNQKAYTGVHPMSKPLSLDSKEINFHYETDMATLSNHPCTAEKFPNYPHLWYPDLLHQSERTDLLWMLYYTALLHKTSKERNAHECDDTLSPSVEKEHPVTWAGFHSLCNETKHQTNTGVVAPILRTSPTSSETLFTALKLAMNINAVVVGPNRKTVITLDLDLYERAVKIRCSEKMNDNIVLRMGELHVVFAMLKALGRYIEGSGLEQIWIEKGLYGPASVRQLLAGKNYKRGLEAHIITLLALKDLHFDSLVGKDEELSMKIDQISDCISGSVKKSRDDDVDVATLLEDANQRYEDLKIGTNLHDEDSQKSPQKLFLVNYMNQVQCLLNFIKASRMANWKLHLASCESLVKFFFAHDLYKYARLTPYYLAEMSSLEVSDPETWKVLEEGNMSVFKSNIPFCGLGVDHALEQEIRSLKVMGGITGITQNDKALARYLLTAPEITRLVKDFWNGSVEKKARKEHYQLTKPHKKRVFKNVSLVKDGITNHVSNPFSSDQTELINVFSNAVVSDTSRLHITERDSIGQTAYHKFVHDRLLPTSEQSLWDPMKKVNLKMFKDNGKKIKCKLEKKVVELNEERSLLTRFLLILKARPEIMDISEAIGEYEFTAIPRSLFTSDGLLNIPTDKSEIMLATEIQADTTIPVNNSEVSKVAVIDGMVEVQSLKKDASVKTCSDLGKLFASKMRKKTSSYDEVRILFDRYLDNSLKDQTRAKRAKGTPSVRFQITDNMDITHISMTTLLSHKQTKDELTLLLQKNIVKEAESNQKMIVCVAGTETKTNRPEFMDAAMLKHDHEEADTLIPLHCFDAANSRPGCSIDVFTVDTDVYVLLVYIFSSLPPCKLYMHAGRGKSSRVLDIAECCRKLGSRKCNALLGMHAFTGSDWGGKFSGITKRKWIKLFLDLDDSDEILEALGYLGESLEDPTAKVIETLEKFVCRAYSSKTKCLSLKKLRWELFRAGKESEKLPPTKSSFIPHIQRSNYLSFIWKNCKSPEINVPSPVGHGWEDKDELITPIMCLRSPAPQALLELIKCGCKGKCEKRQCSCVRNNLNCTPACLCGDCHNQAENTEKLVDDGTGDESNSDDTDDEGV